MIEPSNIQPNYVPLGQEYKNQPEGLGIDDNPQSNQSQQTTSSNISEGPDGTVMEGGSLKSPNYNPNTSGWIIKADGSVEFGSGKFRGDITANKITAAGTSVVVSPGDSIQDAIDEVNTAGGGEVLLESGTHTLSDDLTMYSYIRLAGVSSENSIIDCNSGAYSILIKGSNAYTTGTISINNGSTTVTGSGTTFTSAMVGRDIKIKGLWFPIAAVTDSTHLTIGLNYIGPNLSGESYTIASVVEDVYLNNFTIKDSTTSAIEIQYANEIFAGDLSIQTSAIGIDMDDVSQVNYDITDFIACDVGTTIDNADYCVFNENGVQITSTGNGWTFNNCTNIVVNDNFITGCAGDGVSISNSTEMGFKMTTISYNGGQGVELVSGNDNIVFQNCGLVSNTSDGIKLTASSDNCHIGGGFFNSNGGYGINIADSSCDDNDIRGNRYDSNTSGKYNDSGTDTLTDAFEYSAGSKVIAEANTERNTSNDTYTKLKDIAVVRTGTITVDFEGKFTGSTESLYDYYNTGDDGADGMSSSNKYQAQTFTASASYTIESVKLKLFKTGSPGTFTVEIQGVDGSGDPDGSAITSGTYDGDTLTTSTSGAWYQITFGAGTALTSGTEYAIVVYCSTADASNYITMRLDSSSPTYSDGYRVTSTDGGSSWSQDTTRDYVFETYGPVRNMNARIYLNGAAEGTERDLTTSYVNYSENIEVSAGDNVQVYAKTDTGSETSYVKNFKIKTADYEVATVVTD